MRSQPRSHLPSTPTQQWSKSRHFFLDVPFAQIVALNLRYLLCPHEKQIYGSSAQVTSMVSWEWGIDKTKSHDFDFDTCCAAVAGGVHGFLPSAQSALLPDDTGIGRNEDSINKDVNQKDLPPLVQLSPGTHKYVLVRAKMKRTRATTSLNADPPSPFPSKTLWFVKSASPQECGGAYHRYVAKDLVQRLQSLGWQTRVTGGGRIQYNADEQTALVYGYSNRYGKGDHVLAAKLISENTSVETLYDLADGLY